MLRIRTGYSFRTAAGKLEEVMSRLVEVGAEFAPITDRASTFGFYRWSKLAEKNNLKPVFGVELAVTDSVSAKKPATDYWTFIAQDDLKYVNRLVEEATTQFRYQPLLTIEQAAEAEGVFKVAGRRPLLDWAGAPLPGVHLPLGPSTPRGLARVGTAAGWPWAATSDNYFPRREDKGFYEVLCGRGAATQTYDQHIQTSEEWAASVAHLGVPLEPALANSRAMLQGSTAQLKRARLPIPEKSMTLEAMCREDAPKLGCNLESPVYAERLRREIDLITLKNYEDYFYIVADIVQWARKHMIVGPARGSSCGSLVCYLLGITTIDPIPYKLIFERFLDINRNDLPDIDIDFSDQQRYMAFDYIAGKYGTENVARLGTVALFKPRSALQEAGTALRIPRWKCEKVVEALTRRFSGDSGALNALVDTFTTTPAGIALINDHPEAAVIPRFEGHPRHSSSHAAGVVIADQPITDYVAVDHRTGATNCDKYDAEEGYNFLKIDALGLTQLSVFEDALELAGLPRNHLGTLPLDDDSAFKVLRDHKWAGIFQFNGQALQSLATQVKIDCLEDIVAITALARPGPLASGGATAWVNAKNGAEVHYPHPLFEPYLKDTFGVICYQEQVMEIGREIGDLSWGDVTLLRKAMSKSLGQEHFDQFGNKWKSGAIKKGIDQVILNKVWDDLCTHGKYSFNRSHSVAYGIISYWCCWLKSRYPFEFAAATLTHEIDPSKQIALLREMTAEGYAYIPIDPEYSEVKWTVATRDDQQVLVGPLSMVKGIGPKIVQSIIGARARGEPIPDRAQKLLATAKTPINSLWPITDRVKVVMPDPVEQKILDKDTKVIPIGMIDESHDYNKTFVIIGLAAQISPKNENETATVAKRGSEITIGPLMSLNLKMEDDTGTIYCKVDRWNFEGYGQGIVDRGRVGKAIYAVKGKAMPRRRFLMVEAVKYIGDMEE